MKLAPHFCIISFSLPQSFLFPAHCVPVLLSHELTFRDNLSVAVNGPYSFAYPSEVPVVVKTTIKKRSKQLLKNKKPLGFTAC